MKEEPKPKIIKPAHPVIRVVSARMVRERAFGSETGSASLRERALMFTSPGSIALKEKADKWWDRANAK